jgi:hypothetical protein
VPSDSNGVLYGTSEAAVELNRGPERNDSVKSVRRFDYLQAVHMDPERTDGALATVDPSTGFLKVDARLARIGVQIYGDAEGNRWGELRTEDEVFNTDSMQSFSMAVLTNDHPAEFVNSSNVKDVQIGHTGSDVRRDGNFMRATLLVTDAQAIQDIKDGKVELSNAYTADMVSHEGTTDGLEHSFRQTNIRGNHVALVDRGRAGPMCRLMTDSGDAYSEPRQTKDTMKTRKITIGGVEHDVTVAVADALDAEAKKAEDAKLLEDAKNPFAEEEEEEEDEGKKKGDAADVSALRAKVDMLEADGQAYRDGEAARIDARASLIATAKTVSSEIKTDGLTNDAIMASVVLSIRPEFKAKLDANKGNSGYLQACYEQACELHTARGDASNDLNTVLHAAVKNGASAKSDAQELDELYVVYQDGLGGRRRGAQEEGK